MVGVPSLLLLAGGVALMPDGWQVRLGAFLLICGAGALAIAIAAPQVAGDTADLALEGAIEAVRSAFEDELEQATPEPTEATLLARLDALAEKYPRGIDVLARVAVPLSVPLVAGVLAILAAIVAALIK